jgi:hypothetical protein
MISTPRDFKLTEKMSRCMFFRRRKDRSRRGYRGEHMKHTVLFWLVLGAVLFAALISSAPSAEAGVSGCYAHRPKYIEGVFEVVYDSNCTGHDEPELDPVSAAPGSARDLTWTAVLPADGAFPVSATGPTFWFGGTVTDPKSLFGQSFVELQFYPDAILSSCGQDGGFEIKLAPNAYSVCSPVWRLTSTGQKGVFHETAAFNAMLTNGTGPNNPLVMYAGDTITVHWFTTAAQDGFHVTVTDLTTGGSGTIVLNSSNSGPLMPAFDTQAIGNALGWGSVFDTPNSFVWEIGHESVFTGKGAFCFPGQVGCDSYNAAAWAGTSPIQILSVTFGDGSQPKKWAAVSDLGGKAEVAATCSSYGGPYCIYPWYSMGETGFHFGVDFPDTINDFGQANQYQQTLQCGGPFGPNTTYCDTVLK